MKNIYIIFATLSSATWLFASITNHPDKILFAVAYFGFAILARLEDKQ